MSGPYAEILRALQLLTPEDGIFEVRALNPWTASGYYDADHLEQAAKAIEALDAAGTYEGIYFTLNEITPALLSRRANRIETRMSKSAATTSDDDVIRRRWFVVDIDAERASGISSTDEEHSATLEVAGKIARFLSEYYEFPAPIVADSGNGAHLLYRIDLPNDETSKALIERCLKALGAAFDTPAKDGNPGWEVDPTMANAARICKLYGTLARKGDHTPERPHRRARILEVPEPIEVAPLEVLEALAARAPEEEPQQRDRPRSDGPGIDLEDWLQEYGASLPSYRPKSRSRYQTFYEFEVCPWDPSHRDRSAWVGQLTSGALDAGCHHKSCTGNKWRDLRDLVEPKQTRPKPARTVKETPAPVPAAVSRDVATLDALFEVSRNGQVTIKYARLAEIIHEELHTVSFNDALYVYENGVYQRDRGRIAARMNEILKTIGYDGAFTTIRREVTAYLLAENPQSEYPFNRLPWHLPVKNGVLRVDPDTHQIDLVPHSPEYRFSYRLPVTYNPDANPTHIMQVLSQWVEDDDILYLLQPPAVAILQMWGRVQKQLFLFEGAHDGGKTTYCEFLYGFFGEGGYSQVDLYRLTEDRFALADLEHKLANIHDEMRAVAVRSVGSVKNLTGGLKHRIERKHEAACHVTLTAVHVFTCNSPPKIKEVDDDAFWSRWVYVTFPNKFPRNDGWKAALFTDENYSAFLNLVLKLVVAVMKDPAALKRMDADEVKRRWVEAADTTVKFLWAVFERDPASTIPKDDVYSAYIRYCQENGVAARAKSVFSMDLNRLGIPGTRPREGGDRKQSYLGIRWKDASSSLPSGQGGQGVLNLIACERKEVQSTDLIYTNKVVDTPDHPDQGQPTVCSIPVSGTEVSGDNGDLATWFEKLRLPRNFTVAKHRHNPDRPPGLCSVGLCNRQPTYEDETGSWPICEHHYELIRQREATVNQEAGP